MTLLIANGDSWLDGGRAEELFAHTLLLGFKVDRAPIYWLFWLEGNV